MTTVWPPASRFGACFISPSVETTLGLGEIVPTTAVARVLVASQAISGVILAGLFLNAAVYRASGRWRRLH
ncbi:MAG: ion channel [Methylocystis sp.]